MPRRPRLPVDVLPRLGVWATAERTIQHQSNDFTASRNRCDEVRSGTTLKSALIHFSRWLAAETGVHLLISQAFADAAEI